ncbi:MAG: hypothetical protein GXO79_02545 [Chlorobi bacterium]|nr:hypothetical protein [Chlorobiota bacterium]
MKKTSRTLLLKFIKPATLFGYLLFFTLCNVNANNYTLYGKKDTVKAWQLKHNPILSPILSATIPGLGQIYNRKIWKAPIIYGGFYGLFYAYKYNNTGYKNFYYAYVSYPKQNTSYTGTPYREQLAITANYYKKYRSLSLIGIIGWYTLNIIDASIDAYTIKTNIFTKGKVHNPQRAAVLSAALPGLGQLYNNKWYKVPFIYGGYAGLYYSWQFNNNKFELFSNVYNSISQDKNAPSDSTYLIEGGSYVKDNIYKAQEYYRRYRDLSLIGVGMLYLLNIIDATVDAYMFNYDISDDLSLKIQPDFIDVNSIYYSNQYPVGLKLTFKF